MKENTTSPEEIARLRSDLDTIQTAIGGSLPFEKNDIRFCWAVAAALLICAILHYSGFNQGSGLYLSITPLLLTAAAYFIYMALRSRRRSDAAPVIKKEYRFAVFIMALLLIGLLLFKKWAISQGIEVRSFDAICVMTLGIATFAMAFLPFSAHRAFRRLSIGTAGVMMLIMGILLPSLANEFRIPVLYAIGVIGLSFQAVVMQFFLQRENTEPVSDGQ